VSEGRDEPHRRGVFPDPKGLAPVAPLRQALLVARRVLKHALELLLALILLFEEWGWRPLADLIGRLARFPLWARMEAQIAALPPYGALFAFLLPVALVFPLKVMALYLVATGHLISATVLLLAAKVAGTAVLARVFTLTQPQLMRVGWFATLYNTVMPWKEALFAHIRATPVWRYGRLMKARAKMAAGRLLRQVRPRLALLRAEAVQFWRQISEIVRGT
jgi:hypothetical protein